MTRPIGRHEGVVAHEAHAERLGPLGHERADATEPDDPEHLVRELHALPTAALPSTVDERSVGLMNRESMPQFDGMLFVYDSPRSVGFWMKNTLIPLDMIFLDKTGTVKKVHSNAKPLDENPIMGGNGILAVLEINGGLARKIGISEGWQMRHPRFDQETAAWPCDGKISGW